MYFDCSRAAKPALTGWAPWLRRFPATTGRFPGVGCFVVLFALISPRLALFFVAIFSDLLSRAFDSWFIPFLGFFLLPWTTLAYACMWSLGGNEVSGFEWFLVILAFLADLSGYGLIGNQRRTTAR